ncbi:hypothetical protein BRARA_I05516 [Brassica rapa]|uniref:Uncharacterized protein n=2 Tax=Brassica campestris TaxID=3711 RepID=A0A397Y625_BRACM|nr:uncharacterized protein LOC103843676 [Brassica rapa]XP_013664841.2 uncharacterized protein BNAA09G50740D [Brassica napus]KAG5387570.1 hypothetical protein IGI04_039040 [Brassica rapa subsp. trilocularis]RID49049.1 hypothetical protein BRARA_I05516 [Brassica rapa]CAG7867608.1 unnamed protein product [Brassica rapa]VDC64533.1 unnamed protein product [Brassica rapa]
MNTKTMRLPPRRVQTPDKRKERDGVISSVVQKPPETSVKKLPPPHVVNRPPVNSNTNKSLIAAEPVGSNQLILAGYLSHEFLTNGTLFGEQWDPARAQAGTTESMKLKRSHISEPAEESEPKRKRYVEVANLLRSDGAHLPGIVNPAQLARFLKL